MSKRSRPCLFRAELNFDRNITDLISCDPKSPMCQDRVNVNSFQHQCGTQLVWELECGILCLYELDNLSKTIKKGDHCMVKSPIVKYSSEVEVT